MRRCTRFVLGLVVILSISVGTVHALDWGWGGWGGWVDTPEGSIARGMGYYYTGAGIYNEKTAIADSINVDTMIRWNQYLHEANLEATRRYIARRSGQSAKNRALYNERVKNLQENPTARDIETGDALNAALNQLIDPRISSSALRIATAPIEASVIREIPFRNASEAVTIVLSQVKAVTKWPAALEGDRFSEEKKTFDEIVEKALEEDETGDISPATLKRAHELIAAVRGKLAAAPLEETRASQQATRFLKSLAGLVRMLETPDTTEAFNQLRMIKTTPLGNLIAFMEVYNLRFGASTTPTQRQIYRQLYETLDQVRDRVVKESKIDLNATAAADPNIVGDFFSKVDLDQTEGKPKK
jgi:hypothetical protein